MARPLACQKTELTEMQECKIYRVQYAMTNHF
uniref:Uncharacterized protein n=1 Tax=Anguilla anguilla TaxID=7936 RepID=A0A0E9XP61_ANGAN